MTFLLLSDKTKFTFRLHRSELSAVYASFGFNMHMQFHRDVKLQTGFHLSSVFNI